MIPLTDNIMLVEVPEDANMFDVIPCMEVNMACYYDDSGNETMVKIPAGSYTILGTIKKGIADFDVEPYVDGNNGMVRHTLWRDYKYPSTAFAPFHCPNPTASFTSLLQSKAVDLTKHYLVIEKI